MIPILKTEGISAIKTEGKSVIKTEKAVDFLEKIKFPISDDDIFKWYLLI